jgi:hypothetical protein
LIKPSAARSPARDDALHVGARADDAFREQEPDREILIVPGRAHRDGNRLLDAAAVAARIAQPDLERLLGRDEIRVVGLPELSAAKRRTSSCRADCRRPTCV